MYMRLSFSSAHVCHRTYPRQFLLSNEKQRQADAFRSMGATAPYLVAAATIGIKPKDPPP